MKIIIVGAGVAGLSIGWRLQQMGAAVSLFDRAQAAMGASWASAGMIAAGGELRAATTPEAEFARHSSGLWRDFATEIEEASGQSIAYRRCGSLLVARTQGDLATSQSWPGAERLDAAQTLAKEPMLTPDIAGSLWVRDDAQVDSRALGLALTTAFKRAGGTLITNETVLRITVQAGRAVSITTPFKQHEAEIFILAAGAWSGTIDGLPQGAVPPIKPIKGQMLAIVPPAGGKLPAQIIWGNGGYMVSRDDRLLIGATSEDVGFDTGATDEAANLLSSRARDLMPELGVWKVIERWAGLRPASADGLPLLGRTIVEGLFAATGQYRNGILFAPALAQKMCRIVLENEVEIAAFDPRRFARGT